MEVMELLESFSAKTGLGKPVPNAAGLHRLVFDERWAVDIEDRSKDDGPSFLLYSVAGPIAPDASAAILRRCLEANLFVRDANDAFVAINSHLNELVVMCRRDCASMDLAGFEIALRDFVDQVEYWNEYLQNGEPAASDASAHMAEHFIRA
jgi:hypothetical protein